MSPDAFNSELEHRLELIESPDDNGMVLEDLPVLDVALCAVGLAVGAALLMWWSL
ncbi:hypothetical protein [Rhodococcoides fascians]|uniref:hypothetical protein n=1 Tax=Rhodococcoides fascians TaxID=1828 RepID=UPI001E2B9AF6|nr:hypothetical protein [Rhodococcus fascians]